MCGVRSGRRRPRRAVTLVCVIGLLLSLSSGPGAAQSLDQVRERLDGARGGLQQVEEQRAVTVADLEASQARQAAMHERLLVLTAELGAAQGSLEAADAVLGSTTRELEATRRQLEETREDLDVARLVFADRTRASYMYGGAGRSGASVLFGVADVTEFNRAVAYVQRVMASDREQIALVGNLERQVAAATVELGLLQERHRTERAVAQVERDRVANLVTEQDTLHREATAEADHHARILTALDADRASHVALIDALEAESDQLEAELRRRAQQEEARRLAAAEAARASRASQPQSPAVSASGWQRPSDGRMSSGYGMRRHPIYGSPRLHTGVDFGAPIGAPIYAATAGTVVSAGWRGGYGLAVVVDHGGGVATLYAHASALLVSPGQSVSRGQVIARTGSTGQSTGPHLHFEVRVNGQPRDPVPYL